MKKIIFLLSTIFIISCGELSTYDIRNLYDIFDRCYTIKERDEHCWISSFTGEERCIGSGDFKELCATLSDLNVSNL